MSLQAIISQPGRVLFEIIDLSEVWVLFDAYESDLNRINRGDEITFTIAALPATELTAPVTFVDPVINHTTHTAGVRG
ncbi:MAG: efflux RND transporter periplasmic adaptor subunit [Bacteroidales bacterium]